MQKSFLLFKQLVVLFVFSLFSLSVFAQDAGQSQGLIFGGGQTSEPQFEGGYEAMFKFIDDNLVYPKAALDGNISGRVILQMRIDMDGNVKDEKVLNLIGQLEKGRSSFTFLGNYSEIG